VAILLTAALSVALATGVGYAMLRAYEAMPLSGGRMAFKRRVSAVPVDQWPEWARLAFEWCVAADGRWPYVYGGGHNARFAPDGGTHKLSINGYDCSAIICAALRRAHILNHPSGPFGTHELEREWGVSGVGEWVTVWVFNGTINGVPVEHCVFEFSKADRAHRYFMAFFTGGPRCGFLSSFDTSHYHARHKA
jgi:hypothetical protein